MYFTVEMDTGKTTSYKVVESALSGSAQHTPCPNKYQLFPWKMIFYSTGTNPTDAFEQNARSLIAILHCDLAYMCLPPPHCWQYSWTGLSPSCIGQQTSTAAPFPTLPPGMCTVFPVPTNSTPQPHRTLPKETGNVVQWHIAISLRGHSSHLYVRIQGLLMLGIHKKNLIWMPK